MEIDRNFLFMLDIGVHFLMLMVVFYLLSSN